MFGRFHSTYIWQSKNLIEYTVTSISVFLFSFLPKLEIHNMNSLQTGGSFFFFSFLTTIFCSGSSLLFGLSLVLVFFEGFLLRWLFLWQSVGSRHVGFSNCRTQAQWLGALECTGSIVVAGGLSCLTVCGIFSCLLHWGADSYPLYHQGSPGTSFKKIFFMSLSWTDVMDLK